MNICSFNALEKKEALEFLTPCGQSAVWARNLVALRPFTSFDELRTNAASEWQALPEEAQLVLANMMFNMVKTRLSKFVKLRKAIEAFDYGEASNQMKYSKWYTQVTNRADRLVKRMKAIEVTE